MADEARKISEDDLKRLLARELASAESHIDAGLAVERQKALDYFEGRLPDLIAESGRSEVVSRDVSDTVGWMLPGIMGVFMASQNMVLAAPVGDDDDEWARQATILLNHVFWKDNAGYRVLRDATWDALVLKNAIIKVYHDDTPKYQVTFHSGLSDDALAQLVSNEDVEVLQHTETIEEILELSVDPVTGQPVQVPTSVTLHEVKIKRLKSSGRRVIECIPPEDYLQDADAITTGEARFRAHRSTKTRSDLVEMGFDRDAVDALSPRVNDDPEKTARDEDDTDGSDEGTADHSMEEIDLYECYERVDIDGDGIAEMVRAYYAGSKDGGTLLDWEVWEDEGPFFDIPCEPIPHRWEGKSVADDTMDVMKTKTALLRQYMDNVYASNNPQRFAVGKIINPEQLFSPTFGGVIFGEAGATVEDLSVPLVAQHALEALAYQDEVAQRRTGVSRQSMALDPEALQNQTAEASRNNRDASYSQTQQVARDMAELGWTPVFRALLKLEIKHQDTPRTIRLNGKKTVKVDPKSWNADMDITIDVGLGTGSRERDMAMLRGVLSYQMTLIDRLTNSGFPEKALQMVPMVLHTLNKLAESAGLNNPGAFFPEVTAQEMQAALQRIEQMRSAGDPKLEQEKQKIQIDAQKAAADLQFKREQMQAEMELKREQLTAEMELKRELAMAELQMRARFGQSAVVPSSMTGSSGVRLGGEPG